MLRRLPLIALILAGSCTLAQADVYRWVDEHGVPHYSDQWVPGSEIIKTTKAHPNSDFVARNTVEQKSFSGFNQRTSSQLAEQDNARAMQQDLTRAKDVQCKKARDAYTNSITHRRIYNTGKDGERTYLSDEELDKYRAEARKLVQDACGSVPKFDPDAPIPEPQPIPEPKVNPAAATSE